jgi:hypothetical protein
MSHRPVNPDAPHGSISTYVNQHCRCQDCRNAMATYRRNLRAKYAKNGPPPDIQHGTVNAYNNYVCRCAGCRDVKHQAYRMAAASP